MLAAATTYWDITLRSWAVVQRRFGETHHLHYYYLLLLVGYSLGFFDPEDGDGNVALQNGSELLSDHQALYGIRQDCF
jgi:hypothetical protein